MHDTAARLNTCTAGVGGGGGGGGGAGRGAGGGGGEAEGAGDAGASAAGERAAAEDEVQVDVMVENAPDMHDEAVALVRNKLPKPMPIESRTVQVPHEVLDVSVSRERMMLPYALSQKGEERMAVSRMAVMSQVMPHAQGAEQPTRQGAEKSMMLPFAAPEPAALSLTGVKNITQACEEPMILPSSSPPLEQAAAAGDCEEGKDLRQDVAELPFIRVPEKGERSSDDNEDSEQEATSFDDSEKEATLPSSPFLFSRRRRREDLGEQRVAHESYVAQHRALVRNVAVQALPRAGDVHIDGEEDRMLPVNTSRLARELVISTCPDHSRPPHARPAERGGPAERIEPPISPIIACNETSAFAQSLRDAALADGSLGEDIAVRLASPRELDFAQAVTPADSKASCTSRNASSDAHGTYAESLRARLHNLTQTQLGPRADADERATHSGEVSRGTLQEPAAAVGVSGLTHGQAMSREHNSAHAHAAVPLAPVPDRGAPPHASVRGSEASGASEAQTRLNARLKAAKELLEDGVIDSSLYQKMQAEVVMII